MRDVSQPPGGRQRVYVLMGRNLYAVNRSTGVAAWQRTISSYTHVPGDKARATPALSDTSLVIGTQGPFGGGGRVLAIDKATGELLWSTQLDTNPATIITQSATIHNGVVYVGTASLEEAFSVCRATRAASTRAAVPGPHGGPGPCHRPCALAVPT